jgi:hypothetical protein
LSIMPPRPDERLSASKICEIVGVSLQQRQALIRRKLLAREPRRGCSIVDALQLAAISSLADRLSPSAVAVVSPFVRESLGAAVPGRRFDVVFHMQLGEVVVARDNESLRAAVAHGRPVQVIALGERLQEVGDAFRRWTEAAAAGRRSPARSQRRQTR